MSENACTMCLVRAACESQNVGAEWTMREAAHTRGYTYIKQPNARIMYIYKKLAIFSMKQNSERVRGAAQLFVLAEGLSTDVF